MMLPSSPLRSSEVFLRVKVLMRHTRIRFTDSQRLMRRTRMRHIRQTMEWWSSDSNEAELDSKEGKYDSTERQSEKSQKNRTESAYIHCHSNLDLEIRYGEASISGLLQIIGLFCRRALERRLYSAKLSYNSKEPTNCNHPIFQETRSTGASVTLMGTKVRRVCIQKYDTGRSHKDMYPHTRTHK